ncbi:hypothetical protein [Syntrophomonas palmitatica]|uniref:hypothetical protein n=1 Tax=Syntrophomonas palmitatica TaxID=402877 RepID=UPI0006D097EC|nr:hypothetical protein [Syntrophomonas palmitatica]
MLEYLLYVILIYIPIGLALAYYLKRDGLSPKDIAAIVCICLLVIATFPISVERLGSLFSMALYIIVLGALALYLLHKQRAKYFETLASYLRAWRQQADLAVDSEVSQITVNQLLAVMEQAENKQVVEKPAQPGQNENDLKMETESAAFDSAEQVLSVEAVPETGEIESPAQDAAGNADNDLPVNEPETIIAVVDEVKDEGKDEEPDLKKELETDDQSNSEAAALPEEQPEESAVDLETDMVTDLPAEEHQETKAENADMLEEPEQLITEPAIKYELAGDILPDKVDTIAETFATMNEHISEAVADEAAAEGIDEEFAAEEIKTINEEVIAEEAETIESADQPSSPVEEQTEPLVEKAEEIIELLPETAAPQPLEILPEPADLQTDINQVNINEEPFIDPQPVINQSSDINSLIDQGFRYKSNGQELRAIDAFNEAWLTTHNLELKYLLTLELLDLYKETGNYSQAEMTMGLFIESGEIKSDIINEIHYQLEYIRLLAAELNRLGMNGLPYSKVPRWIRLEVEHVLSI